MKIREIKLYDNFEKITEDIGKMAFETNDLEISRQTITFPYDNDFLYLDILKLDDAPGYPNESVYKYFGICTENTPWKHEKHHNYSQEQIINIMRNYFKENNMNIKLKF